MSEKNIGFIGGGNMARSMIGGLVESGTPASCIFVADINAPVIAGLRADFGVNATDDAAMVCENADVLVLAVKPQTMQAACESIHAHISPDTLIISIAAGIDCTSIETWLNAPLAIVRSMPNTPALIQTGATGLYANTAVNETQRNTAEHLLRSVGLIRWVESERLIDAVTATSGSGPAYFFYVMEVMQQAAEGLGLNSEDAKLLTLQTALGAAKMAIESPDDLATLRARVTSPGGTTEQGILALQNANLETIFDATLNAAYHRAIELNQELS